MRLSLSETKDSLSLIGNLRSKHTLTSVLTRTAAGKENLLSYHAGCGIVWDSEPEKELAELYLKVKAFCKK